MQAPSTSGNFVIIVLWKKFVVDKNKLLTLLESLANDKVSKMNSSAYVGLLIITIVCLPIIVVISGSVPSDGQPSDETHGSTSFADLPRLFDFEQYQKAYGKQYSSYIDQLVRQKLFLSRAFKVFISSIGYKYHKQSHYLSLNKFSDWTGKEVSQLYRSPSESHPGNRTKYAETNDCAKQQVKTGDVDLESSVEFGSALPAMASLQDVEDMLNDGLVERREQGGLVDDITRELFEKAANSANQQSSAADAEVPATRSSALSRVLTNLAAMEENRSTAASSSGERQRVREKSSGRGGEDVVYIDHRKCFAPVRDQGSCGSCYIFSAISNYEWLYCQETAGKRAEFSEQYVLDCGGHIDPPITGCDGGWEEEVATFVGIYGLELRSNYPYRDKRNQCPYSRRTQPKKMGYVKVREPGLITVGLKYFDRTLKRNPIMVVIWVSGDFNSYGGGVDEGRRCRTDDNRAKAELHAVVIVGSGRQDGIDYWLIRNSHGDRWGENGYYKLSKRANCFREPEGQITRAKFNVKHLDSKQNTHYDAAFVKRRLLETNSE